MVLSAFCLSFLKLRNNSRQCRFSKFVIYQFRLGLSKGAILPVKIYSKSLIYG